MTPEQMAQARLLLFNSFPIYAAHALKIRTKNGEIAPLVLNAAQQQLVTAIAQQRADTGRVRIIILKARQLGLSTVVGARLYWAVAQRQAQKAIVVTHHADSTRALFDMTKRYHELVPEFLRPSTRYSSKRELQFDKLQSGYVVATAGGDGVGRGETLTHAHVSELAFWTTDAMRANFNGLMQAVPEVPGTEIYIESTANGVSGLFYEQWQAAVAGDSGYVPVFIPWYVAEEYRLPVVSCFDHTPEETELIRLFGLDDEQLMFRRQKIAQYGLEGFQQEYPSTAEEAFLTSGRPVFHPERLAEMWHNVRDPLYRMALTGDQWDKHSRGELSVYRQRDPAEHAYTIGADISLGVNSKNSDWSVAQVLDSKKRQVAVWRGQIIPDEFGRVLYHLGRYYNDAWVCPEGNNHGILTNHVLAKELAYPYVYQDTIYDTTADTETKRVGFLTTEKSKPLIINKLRAEVRDSEIEIYDRVTIQEMRSFIVTETGRMEGEKGSHDDCVIALALSNHINEGGFEPIPCGDDWYFNPEE